MIRRVSTVSVFVSDQERAKVFYTDVLGLDLRSDAPLYPGAAARWIAVAPEGAETEIILYLPDENWEHYRQVVGKTQALTLEVSNLAAVHAQLSDRGVVFIQEPDTQPWGTFAIIQDSEGNHLLLVEQAES
jgi:lactoylglutathione lyase